MILDSGMVAIFEVCETATPGYMPNRVIRPLFEPAFYGELNVGYKRQYAAMGVSQQIDRLIRIWQERGITIGMVAQLDSGEQYRIDHVQHLPDERGEPVTHLTLRRLDSLYDIAR